MDRRARFPILPKTVRSSWVLPTLMWPPGWRALIWQTLTRLGLAGLILALMVAALPLPGIPQAPHPPAAPHDLAQNPRPLPQARVRAWKLTADPFRADRRFPPVARRAAFGGIPTHWRSLPRQPDPRLQLLGVAGPAGNLEALVGTVNHEAWQTVGAFVDNWRLVAIRPHRALWAQGGAYAVSGIIEAHHPQTDRPRPAALFAGGHG